MAYVYQKNDIITLKSNASGYYPIKPYSQGRWYYEFTHIDGDHYHYLGFRLDYGQRVYLYQMGSSNIFRVIFFDGMTVVGKENYEDLKFKDVVSNHTVGLGFDIYQKTFTIYYLNQIQKLELEYSNSAKKVAPQFGEGFENTIFTDQIRYNFGSKSFQYEIPENYLPWNITLSPTIHCNCKYNIQYHFLFIICLNS